MSALARVISVMSAFSQELYGDKEAHSVAKKMWRPPGNSAPGARDNDSAVHPGSDHVKQEGKINDVRCQVYSFRPLKLLVYRKMPFNKSNVLLYE